MMSEATAKNSAIIVLKDGARNHILRLMEREKKRGSYLRFAVVGGGCSGMSYKMSFEDSPANGDNVFEANGIRVVIDPKSALFLRGLEVDYADGLEGAGFSFENPNAKKSCGCGTSFSA